jgi:hypothetical protein
MYGFGLLLWYLLAIVLFVLDLPLLLTPLISFGHCVVRLLRFTDSDYSFGIFWPLHWLSSLIYGFGLPLWYLLAIVLFVFLDLQLLISPLGSFGHCVVCLLQLTASDYPFDILDLRLLITPLIS